MAPRLRLWLNKARIFLDPLREKFYRKYLALYLKMIVRGGANTLKYMSFMMHMVS
jgi:hypothetical protein